MRQEIRSQWSGDVLFSTEAASWRIAVEAAVTAEADLHGANLRGAKAPNGQVLVGNRPFFIIGPIGSRGDYLSAWMTDAGVWCVAGCWSGSLDDFRSRVREVYGAHETHGREYLLACDLISTHAALWAPAIQAEDTPSTADCQGGSDVA